MSGDEGLSERAYEVRGIDVLSLVRSGMKRLGLPFVFALTIQPVLAAELKPADLVKRMSWESPVAWKSFHEKTISAGQSLENALRQSRPRSVERYGRYAVLQYGHMPDYTGLTAIAQDGRLVRAWAWSCTWKHDFFNTWSRAEYKAFARDRAKRGLFQLDIQGCDLADEPDR